MGKMYNINKNNVMKRKINLFIIAMLFLMGFTACEQNEKPGGIPGMGDTPGELEVAESFEAPEGISIDVKGSGVISVTDENAVSVLKSSMEWDWSHIFGCGGSFHGNNKFVFWITVDISINNNCDSLKCITISRGTIFKVSDPRAQNGILLEDVKVCVKAHSVKKIKIMLMCLNRGRHGSEKDMYYEILGVTNSNLIKELLSFLKGKKIGLEHYIEINNGPVSLKSVGNDYLKEYREIADHIQNSIWKLTNEGKNLSQEDIDYFKSLPDIE
jgi:hypothetical protein